MGLLSGLEKFGLDQMDTSHLFDDEKRPGAKGAGDAKEAEHKETDFLLAKTTRCPVCDHVFHTRMVKTGRARRLEPDFDLRPRFAHIDTNKYDITSCPKCGYTAIHRNFPHLLNAQIKMIEEGVRKKFKPDGKPDPGETVEAYTYEEAIERYKLALYCTIVKKGKASEKAYECLKLSWLYRGMLEELAASGVNEGNVVAEAKKQEGAYYSQAYEGFLKAVESETFPMCGMDEGTVNILLASMAFKLGNLNMASKLVSMILTSRSANRSVKNRAMDLKTEIIEKLRKAKETGSG